MNKIPIIYDTDCLSCFLIVNQEGLLQKLFNKIIIPKQVYDEFQKSNIDKIIRNLKKLINDKFIEIYDFEINSPEHLMYMGLKKGNLTDKKLGKGESAALAITSMQEGILASNNTKDVITVVKEWNLSWITTGDILIKAYEKNLITEEKGNYIWVDMINKNRFLPAESFSEYLHDERKHPPNYL